eukprot:m.101111 g.101111  ORF g.101111 m.101111 type:complete len:335 (+) comp15439_c0_seq3:646-1650(+)
MAAMTAAFRTVVRGLPAASRRLSGSTYSTVTTATPVSRRMVAVVAAVAGGAAVTAACAGPGAFSPTSSPVLHMWPFAGVPVVRCDTLNAAALEETAEAVYLQQPAAVYGAIIDALREASGAADGSFDKDAVLATPGLSAGVLWRLARGARDLSCVPGTSKADSKKLIYEGLEYAKRALELDDKDFAVHKWVAIMLARKGDYEGSKAKLLDALPIKHHFSMAVELNPKDPTSRYLLGMWCFSFAELSWYERKAANTFLAAVPEVTYDEALTHFEDAEKVEPGFYTTNRMMLGKTLARLNRKEEARNWLEQCLSMECQTPDDAEAQKEAKQLLASL